jgi:hypothetical protein
MECLGTVIYLQLYIFLGYHLSVILSTFLKICVIGNILVWIAIGMYDTMNGINLCFERPWTERRHEDETERQ